MLPVCKLTTADIQRQSRWIHQKYNEIEKGPKDMKYSLFAKECYKLRL